LPDFCRPAALIVIASLRPHNSRLPWFLGHFYYLIFSISDFRLDYDLSFSSKPQFTPL
jgi:hypothetical protein